MFPNTMTAIGEMFVQATHYRMHTVCYPLASKMFMSDWKLFNLYQTLKKHFTAV